MTSSLNERVFKGCLSKLIFALTVQVTRFARDFWLHLGKISKLFCTRFAQKFLIILYLCTAALIHFGKLNNLLLTEKLRVSQWRATVLMVWVDYKDNRSLKSFLF